MSLYKYVDEVGSVCGISDVVVESVWMIVDVEHVTRLVLHVHDLVACTMQQTVLLSLIK